MTDTELEGTAQVLRRQQEHAYSEDRATEGLEYSYRASLCEIALRVRRGEIGAVYPTKPEGGHQPTNRPSRVRTYRLKGTDSDITRQTRWATKQIIGKGVRRGGEREDKPTPPREGFKELPMFKLE